MNHVYLSPHLDDAVLSCGGTIHRHTMAGERVQVITIFAGEAGLDTELSPFARERHAQWGRLSYPMKLRRAENVVALTHLGAEVLHLDYHDAVYRSGADGQCFYDDLEAVFGEVHPSDPVGRDGGRELADRLAHLVPLRDRQVLYAPLGVGHHVDHQVVHAAARRLQVLGQRVAFYEDYLYAEQDGAADLALAVAGADTWIEEQVEVSAVDVSAKVSALCHYQTQMATLFGGTEAMPNRVWSFAAAHAPAICLSERIWWPQ